MPAWRPSQRAVFIEVEGGLMVVRVSLVHSCWRCPRTSPPPTKKKAGKKPPVRSRRSGNEDGSCFVVLVPRREGLSWLPPRFLNVGGCGRMEFGKVACLP